MGADTAHREPGARVRRVGRVADVDHGQGRARRVEATETGSDREKMIIIAHLLSGIINLECKSSSIEFIFGNIIGWFENETLPWGQMLLLLLIPTETGSGPVRRR